jgi:type I restriction enzyme S subunit
MNRISCKLSELVEVKNGSTPSTRRSDFYDGNIVWITPKDLSINKSKFIYSSERKITKAGFDSCSTSLLPIGSVLLSSRAPIGLLAICAVETCTNQGFKNLVLKKDKLHNEYLYYWLKTKVKYIDSLGTGTTFKEVSKGVIENLSIEIPKDIKDQQKIASVLSSLDSKIELNNLINAELESMAKTLYDYWFVQFDFPDINGKPYKTSGGEMVWNEELKREIPDCWESIMIENCLLKESSIKKIPTAEILEKGKFPVVDQSTDFIAGFTNDNEAIIKTDEPRIIFGDHTRILKLINFDFARGADGTQVMLSNNKRMPQHLFFNTLLKIDLSNYGYARHYKFLKDISIILPNETVSKSFETTVSPFYKLIRENIFQNQKLTELRDWLLPMLMNGQVKVN